MTKRVTIRDLANDLGMSVSTISRAFQQNSNIAARSREVVLKRAAELSYTANPFARGLVSKKNKIVGALVSRISSPFYSELLSLLADQLRQDNMTLMLVAGEHASEVQDGLKMLMAYDPLALLVISSYASADTLANEPVPHEKILYFNRPPKRKGSLGLIYDNFDAGQRAAEYLVGLGHRRFAYLSSGIDSFTDKERGRGFLSFCAAHGITAPEVVTATGFTYEAGMGAAPQVAQRIQEIDAVFCAGDLLALGLMDGMRHGFGTEIPKTLSVMGCDDIAMTGWPSHSLTTLHLPRQAMIAEIVRLIGCIAEGRSPGNEIVRVPTGRIVVRGSTGPSNKG